MAITAALLALTGCATGDLEAKAELAEAELFYEIEESEARQRAEEGRAAASRRAEKSARQAAQVAEASRRAAAAEAERLRRNLAEAQRLADEAAAQAEVEREYHEVQELFARGWSTGCKAIAATPRESGAVVSYGLCMDLLESTDVATREGAEDFGSFMAEYAVTETYGP